MSTPVTDNGAPIFRLDQARVAWREIDGDVVAVDMGTAEYLTMNGTGALLWNALSHGATERELATILVQEYGIPAERAQIDVARFLALLGDRGLISRAA